jgi:predicted nucleic acid-binding protein
MIILDTNIVSALMQLSPDKTVQHWLNNLNTDFLRITTVTIMEIEMGIESLAVGKKRSRLEDIFQKILLENFQNKVMEFDTAAAIATAKIAVCHKKSGRQVDIRDDMIAGIALSKKYTLVTRNTKDFAGVGVELINPYDFTSTR